MLPSIRLLRVNYDEGAVPLLIVDDGKDFESLDAEWCALDDAFCDGRIGERQWQEVQSFLRDRGVTVIEPSAVQDLCDYYGMVEWSTG
jgi:hypothetical protein